MNYSNRPVPIHFYQVKASDTNLDDIAQRFNVAPEKIEREKKESGSALERGEMLVINLQ